VTPELSKRLHAAHSRITQRLVSELGSDGHCDVRVADHAPSHDPRPWDAPVGGALTAAGLALAALGAWPRPRRNNT
jgi:hypothetical protein